MTESGLSRIWKHMQEHDCGTITAWRTAEDCNHGQKYTYTDKVRRNKSLLSKIQYAGYGVKKMQGSYIEGFGTPSAVEVHEEIFFVVDVNDKKTLESDLRKWGEEFEQDSILFIPSPGKDAQLIGTNKCPNGYPGYGKVLKFDKSGIGFDGEFFTRVKGRPWKFFNENFEECEFPSGYFGKWALKTMAETHWRDIDV
jgi:hypothetical protein